jgi:hypothetical protein
MINRVLGLECLRPPGPPEYFYEARKGGSGPTC